MTPAVNLLKKLNVRHELLSYRHDANSQSYADEAAEKLGLVPSQVFKTLVVECQFQSMSRLCVAIAPATHQLSMKLFAKALKAKKATMADVKKVQSSTGYILGGVSPLAQKKPLDTVLDSSAFEYESIYISAGQRGLEICIDPHNLQSVLGCTAAYITA